MRRNWFRTCWVCFTNSVTGILPLVSAGAYLGDLLLRKYPPITAYETNEAAFYGLWATVLILGIILEWRLSRWASLVNVSVFAVQGVGYFYKLLLWYRADYDWTVVPTVHDTGLYPLGRALQGLVIAVVNLICYRSVLRTWLLAPKPQG